MVDLRSGAVTELKLPYSPEAVIIAHGVLMAVAWVLLLPLGAMAPAHKYGRDGDAAWWCRTRAPGNLGFVVKWVSAQQLTRSVRCAMAHLALRHGILKRGCWGLQTSLQPSGVHQGTPPLARSSPRVAFPLPTKRLPSPLSPLTSRLSSYGPNAPAGLGLPPNQPTSASVVCSSVSRFTGVYFTLPRPAAIARRWLFGGRQIRGKAVWYWAHLTLQLTGFAVFVAGFVLAMVRFRRPQRGTLHFDHAVIG